MNKHTRIFFTTAALIQLTFFACAQSKNVNVIYIGDSITYGAGLADPSTEAPTTKADSALKRMGLNITGSSNQGHSGYTTLDFMPGSDAFKQVEAAADTLKANRSQMLFSIMLGTNDSAIQGPHGSPVSKEQYFDNLKIIIDQLLKDFQGSIVVINRQTWYSANTYNGARYLQEELNRLQSYYPEMQRLVLFYSQSNPGKVYFGDTDAFDYFKNNYLTYFQAENGNQGVFYLHPNKAGAVVLGVFWAKAIYKAVSIN